MRRYTYVGPPAIRAAAGTQASAAIATRADLTAWIVAHAGELAGDGFAVTYVVTLDGALRLAPRRSEHVRCAGGGDVLAAGELVVGRDARVVEASNLSTGFCPEPACWVALAAALDRAGVPRPAAFVHEVVFRRCEACGQRNVVKDGAFECAVCDAPLPAAWNFDPPATT
jgi:hypothetical protein